ncbi:MAG: glycoside hydrolase family 88 protein [Bacteroidales bacterium]|nr:glycoside hydrolase family 88 protein [Bacteroidales bacterium]
MYKSILGVLLVFMLFDSAAHSQNLPPKDTVLKQMMIANQYFMDKWPDPGEDIVTDKVRPSNLWTRATYYEGLMALYYVHPDTNYYIYAVDWGESHDWNPTYGNLNTRDADHHACGQTYVELYILDNQPERIENIKTCIDSIVDDNDNDDWWWIDAIHMAMPLFAKLGVVLNDTSYFRKMHNLYLYSMHQHGDNGLYNQDEHLWWRDANFDPPYKTPNGKNCYWSRGNGWVLAALARVLDVLPDTAEHRQEYITPFTEMVNTLIQVQRTDGFWNPSLVDSLDYGGKETSGTAFFTFGIAWGINHGILDSATYIPYVIKGWNGMVNDALHPNGFLGYVQGTGKQPSDGQPLGYEKTPNFEDYGLGAFLLAGSEVYHLAPLKDPVVGSEPFYASDQDWKIFPNPTTNEIHIEGEFSLQFTLTVFDLYGRKLQQHILFNNSSSKINLGDYPPGIYILSIENSTNQKKYRIIKNE